MLITKTIRVEFDYDTGEELLSYVKIGDLQIVPEFHITIVFLASDELNELKVETINYCKSLIRDEKRCVYGRI